MTREDLDKWIVAIHNKEELVEVLKCLDINKEIEQKKFPMIIFQGINESIQLNEITNENLEQLGREKLERKVLWNYSNIKSGLAKRMES